MFIMLLCVPSFLIQGLYGIHGVLRLFKYNGVVVHGNPVVPERVKSRKMRDLFQDYQALQALAAIDFLPAIRAAEEPALSFRFQKISWHAQRHAR